MRVPISWLKEFVDVPVPVPELADRLTFAGLEVAAVERIGLPGSALPWDRERLLVGRIREVTAHPNADRLVLVTVEYGPDRVKTVVTGAPNLKVGDSGQKVAFALEGARLWDAYAETRQTLTLKGRKVRGVYSDGMVCSERELGLSEAHEGILLLDDDAPVGTPLADYLGDEVLELEILPNMARCLSVLGVAREVAALTNGRARVPRPAMLAEGEPISGKVRVTIADPALSARYTATLIAGVRIGPSPGWLQRRLRLAGVRPINNVVDATNYVMLEWGQPLHAFDYDVLVRRAKGVPEITVRPARPREILVTLDGVTRTLTPDRLVIADTAGAIAVAGVMGGAETEVTDGTTAILLESANFHFVSIRKTMQALKLPSEASARFGRGVPPAIAEPAAMRATELIRTLAGGTVAAGIADCYPAPQVPVVVSLSTGDAKRILGMDLVREEMARILTALEFTCEPEGETVLRVTAPVSRLDIGIGVMGVHDLLEEVARIFGYDRIPVTDLADTLPPQRNNTAVEQEDRVRDLLTVTGLQEIVTYRLTTPEREAMLAPGAAVGGEPCVRLANPVSADRTAMRQTLAAGILEAMAQNARNRDRLCFFELGPVFLPVSGETLPAEPRRLGIGMAGPVTPASWREQEPARTDFFTLKGVVEALLSGLHLGEVTFDPVSHPLFAPGRSARVAVLGAAVGVLGEIHPQVRAAFDLAVSPVCLAELDLDRLLAHVASSYPVHPVPRFPPVLEDVALVVEEAVPAAALSAAIRAAGGPLLADVRLFDVYRGEQLASGKKSLAFSLSFQAADRTLTDVEVEAEKRRILEAVSRELGALLRG
ncbi:MAG: phenylalanine--tRNA ligase subunit beta [candidate division NC10 bacterium]|nr:phenylalanine--tRNA ligase subunit beta [candidate division NC10 bacterium]